MKKSKILLMMILSGLFVTGQNQGFDKDAQGLTPRQNTKSVLNPEIMTGKGGNAWTSIGPFGGDVIDIAVSSTDPDVIFAAAGTPYRSTDGGQNWQIMENLLNLSPSGIGTFEAASDGSVYASGPYTYYKIFKSTDNGESWTQKSIPVNGAGLDIAIDPANPDIIYVGLTSVIGSTSNNVIIRSMDGGNNWTWFDMTNILPVGYSVVNLAIDPEDSQIIFAIGNEGFSNALVAATFDGGTTWEDRTGNLPTGKPLNFTTLSEQNVFIAGGQLFGGQVVGVYKSENYGQSWQNISTSFPNKVSNAILIDPADPDKMYVASEGDGIYYTVDGGLNWVFSTGGAGNSGAARCLAFEPGNTNILYAGFLSLGVCKSNDASVSWSLSNHGIATLLTNDIEIDPNDSEKILVGFEAENSGGCYLSENGGMEWTLVEGLPGTRFSKTGFGTDGSLYAWSNGPSSVAQEGLYKSVDNGITWENMGPNIGGLFETEIFSFAISETDPNLIFIGGNNFGVAGWESMVYRSVDGGENWENVYMGPENNSFRYVFIDPNSNDQTVYGAYISQSDHAGFIKSTDSGINWTDINSGIPAINKWGGSIICDPLDSDILYGGIGGYGEIAGTIYKSTDAGLSWVPTSLALGLYSHISDLLISPLNSEVIYAASSQNGVYLSTDAGETWEPSNDSLSAQFITAFSRPFQEPDSTWHFCASSFSNSAFKTAVYDTETSTASFPVPQDEIIIKNNLTDGSQSVAISIKNPGYVSLRLFDVMGRLSETLTENTLEKGDYQFQIAGKPGIYLLVVTVNGKRSVQKVMVSKV